MNSFYRIIKYFKGSRNSIFSVCHYIFFNNSTFLFECQSEKGCKNRVLVIFGLKPGLQLNSFASVSSFILIKCSLWSRYDQNNLLQFSITMLLCFLKSNILFSFFIYNLTFIVTSQSERLIFVDKNFSFSRANFQIGIHFIKFPVTQPVYSFVFYNY